MKKILLILSLFMLCITLSSDPVQAQTAGITLFLDPTPQTVALNDQVAFDLHISGLGFGQAPSLGAFDVTVEWDAAVLGFQSLTFGDPVLGNQLDAFAIGFNPTGVADLPGSVNFFEISLDDAFTLDALQADEFVLARLYFDSIGVGSSVLSINPGNLILSDPNGGPLFADAVFNGLVQVNGNPIPEPATFFLLGSSLLGFLRVRKKYTV